MTLFADKTAAIDQIQSGRLTALVHEYGEGLAFTPEYIYGKLLAAEADAARRLRVFLEPTEVFSEEPPTQVEIDALEGKPWVLEPAYDYSPEFFQGEKWGFLVVRHRPIIAVHEFVFAYPTPEQRIYTVPESWIRLDRKYGYIRLIPTGTPFLAPLNAYILSVVGGGRLIPQAMRVRYTAGLENVYDDYPDLIDTIKKMAILRILEDLYIPSSGSISTDGMSESRSFDMKVFQEKIDDKLAVLKRAIHGVSMAFV